MNTFFGGVTEASSGGSSSSSMLVSDIVSSSRDIWGVAGMGRGGVGGEGGVFEQATTRVDGVGPPEGI